MNICDLVIIAPERASFRHLIERFSDPDELVEIHLERRRGQRRRAPEASVTEDRRRHDRRSLDVSDSLRTAGFAVIPASQRP
jgi:hypothetical protein